jgi:DNA-binding protein HU-beta
MNKADLTEKLAQKAGIPKVRAASYINIITEAIQEELIRAIQEDEDKVKVTISDFGTFTVSKRRAFQGHNPKNGQVMSVPERRIPVFRAGKGLKNALNPNEG